MAKIVRARKVPPSFAPYWEKEEPEIAESDRVRVSYFAKAGKLQATLLYLDEEGGEKRPGKTVVLDRKDITSHPEVAELFVRALTEWLAGGVWYD